MFQFIPREVKFFDLFDQQAQNIIKASQLLRELVHNFADARAKAHAIKEVEHAGDQITHDIVKRLNTTFITPIDREDIHDLATRLDDVLDFIEAAAERLVVYRDQGDDLGVSGHGRRDRADRGWPRTGPSSACARMDPGFHEHAVEINRLENSADNLLRDSLAALFEEQRRPHRGDQVEGDLRDDGDRHRPLRGRRQRDRGDRPQDGLIRSC